MTDEWTPEDIQHFEKILRDLEAKTIAEGDFAIEPNRDEYSMGDDEDEQPLNEMHQAIAPRRNLARQKLLTQLRHSLRRIQNSPDDFGYCLECDAPLSRARIEAIPYALYCVECKSRKEGPLRKKRYKITDYV